MAVIIQWAGGRISMRDEDVLLRVDIEYEIARGLKPKYRRYPYALLRDPPSHMTEMEHTGRTDARGILTIYHAGSSVIADLLDLAASSTPFAIIAKRGSLPECRIVSGRVSQTGRDRRCEFDLTVGGALPGV